METISPLTESRFRDRLTAISECVGNAFLTCSRENEFLPLARRSSFQSVSRMFSFRGDMRAIFCQKYRFSVFYAKNCFNWVQINEKRFTTESVVNRKWDIGFEICSLAHPYIRVCKLAKVVIITFSASYYSGSAKNIPPFTSHEKPNAITAMVSNQKIGFRTIRGSVTESGRAK